MLRDEKKWVEGIVYDSSHLLKNKLRKELTSLDMCKVLIKRIDRVELKLIKMKKEITMLKAELKNKDCCSSAKDKIKAPVTKVASIKGTKKTYVKKK